MSYIDFFEDARKGVQDHISNSADDFYDALVTNSEVIKLPEHIFKGYFLNKLIGLEDDEHWVREWIAIAGTPSSEMDVVDTEGRVLFRVPSLLQSRSVFLEASEADLSYIMSRYEQMCSNIPIQGERFFSEAMSVKIQQLFSGVSSREYLDKWKYILDRYNINLNRSGSTDQILEEGSGDLDDFISY